MFSLILFLPFAAAISILFLGRFFGKIGSLFLSVFNLFLSFFLSILLIISTYKTGNIVSYNFGTWIDYVGIISVSWEFQFDILALWMIVTVTFVSMLVHIYSYGYMENDPFIIRFLSLLSFFTFFMLILLSSSNFLILFLGWEGIGICSYFLIGFWSTRLQANKSALKAIIVNRVGDIALLIAISLIIYLFQSLDFSIVFSMVPLYYNKTFYLYFFEVNVIEFICFWLCLAAIGKSAQLGLHIWLPDAMEGPTPVSALIHAATMVTAGIFLIIRCSFIFEYAPNTLLFIAFIGASTSIFAASTGLLQNDIKKVIAYSTCSQLGYMFFSCGLSNYIGGFFHLINHAFFKALLFLSAGSVIHAMSNEQDMRKMGSLVKLLPVTYSAMLIGSLAIIGWPFLSGFYSKDFLIESSFFSNNTLGMYTFFLSVLTATITVLYSCKLIYLVFLTQTSSNKQIFMKVHESNNFILVPLIFLSIPSIFFGFFFKDFFIGAGNFNFFNSIFIIPKNYNSFDVENLLNLKIYPLIIIFFSSFVFILFYFICKNYLKTSNIFYKSTLLNFLSNKWYFDYFYNSLFKKLFYYCYIMWIILDKGLLEIMQPIGYTFLVNKLNFEYVKKYNNFTGIFYFYVTLFSIFIFFLTIFLYNI